MDKENGIFIHLYLYKIILFRHRKEGNSASCDYIGESGGHNANKKKKSDTERKILYNLIYMWN